MKVFSSQNAIRILGIDPGYAIVGYGMLDYDGYRFSTVAYGSIQTSAEMPFTGRLSQIWDELTVLISKYRPSVMAVERLYFQTNHKTAIDVAQARGVMLLCAAKYNLSVFEYTPLQVKQAVVGYGKAEKKQVQNMTKAILNLTEVPKPDDTADALAIAICHGHCAGVGRSNKKLLEMR